jgi:hypothetical protein
MAADITFERGTFYRFRAMEKIHLGQYRLDIMLGDTFDYDGWELVYGGQTFNAPPLKIKLGLWYVPAEDNASVYVPQPAGVEVRPAETIGNERGAPVEMESASAEESVAGTVVGTNQRRASGQDASIKQHVKPDQVQQHAPAPVAVTAVAPVGPQPVQPRRAAAAAPQGTTDGADTLSEHDWAMVAAANAENQRRIQALAAQPVKKSSITNYALQAEADDPPRSAGPGGKYAVIAADGQEGVEVKTFGSAGGAAVGRENEAVGKTAGVDVTKVTPEQVEARLKPVAQPVRTGPPARTGAMIDETPVPASQAAMAHSTTQIPAEGNESIDATLPGGATGDVAVARSGDNLADLLPDAQYAGKPVAAAATVPDPVAEILEGWDMKRHWKHRVEEAVDFYAHDKDVLSAIYAVESPGVVKQITERLAEQGIAAPKV